MTVWLSLVLLPLSAQEKTDTVYTFRFMPKRDMFYVPYSGNDTELARLEECIRNHKTDILDGKLPLYVDGYCNSFDSETENLSTAKTRSNLATPLTARPRTFPRRRPVPTGSSRN